MVSVDRRIINKIRGWAIWFSGALILSGLWMNDEITTMLLYSCQRIQGAICFYPIPLLGLWSPYDAESLAWFLVFVGIFLGFWASGLRWKFVTKYKVITQEEYAEMYGENAPKAKEVIESK